MKNLIRRLSNWHHWPSFPFYFPIFFVWAWYIIKSRSVWFFSTSNPRLTFGGFEGESKKTMYSLLPKNYFPKSIYVSPKQSFKQVLEAVSIHSFSYPFIVKPDVGMEGILFRKIDNERHLKTYHSKMPVNYIIQEFINYTLEICVFYYRYPQNKSGKISALFFKKFPHIKGDGVSGIKEILQKQQPEITDEILKLDNKELNRILEKNEIFNLSFIGNRYHGATFHDLSQFIDDDLLQLFDEISLSNNFDFGRYDIKCSSIEDLKKGINFSILEFNGAGSVPNHIYTEKYNLIQAYKEISKHWKVLYEISSCNQKEGTAYWGLFKGWRFLLNVKKHFRFLRKYDKKIILKDESIQINP